MTEGQVIGKLGNTGNANASHLHFQLMDGPSLLGSDSLPYDFKSFDYDGQVAPQQIADADDYLSGTFLQGRLPDREPRKNELPLNLAIIDFKYSRRVLSRASRRARHAAMPSMSAPAMVQQPRIIAAPHPPAPSK